MLAGCLFSWLAGMAQTSPSLSTVSPYSRFGIGDFQMNGGQINTGMGGGGIGIRNDSLLPQFINFLNPASFTAHPLVAYEVSLSSNTVQLHNASGTGTFNRTTLGNLALAFPVTKWWGAGFGLVPYTAVGYNVSNATTVQDVGPVTYKYEGSGGVNEVFLSNAFRPFAFAPRHYQLSEKYERLRATGDTTAIKKKLRARTNLANISIGVETSYLFGSLNNVRRDVFPDSLQTFNTKITRRTLFRDVYFRYGIQYSFRIPVSRNPLYESLPDSIVTGKKFFGNKFTYIERGQSETAPLFIRKPGIRVSFGAIFAPPTSINVGYDLFAATYKQVGTIENIRDTILSAQDVTGRITLPAMGGFGFALKKDYKWMFQADYMMQLWSNFTAFGNPEINPGMKNSQRITAGFQLQPSQAGHGMYLGVVQYRLGVHWYQTALELNNTQLNETSVNFGMSFPTPYRTKLGEPVGRTTVNFEYGMRGTTSNNLIREDFLRVTIGFTINDRWFAHYKYD